MSAEISARQGLESRWRGGLSPFETTWNKLMLWVFIVTDGLLFAGFLASYGFTRLASPTWPDPLEVFAAGFLSLMTFVLISSSATMASAVAAERAGQWPRAAKWVGATAAGGLVFLSMQAYEWATLIGEGAGISGNPWGVPLFSTHFFLITGFHGTHVLTGVLVLLVVLVRVRSGRATAEGVELAGLYWHFVDLVWVFIFTLFYLI
jgi:cytochrome c oxidase subunit 3